MVCFKLSIITFLLLALFVLPTTYKGKKTFIYKYSCVIHQKKRLLSLMTRQKFFLQNIKKGGVMGAKILQKIPLLAIFPFLKLFLP